MIKLEKITLFYILSLFQKFNKVFIDINYWFEHPYIFYSNQINIGSTFFFKISRSKVENNPPMEAEIWPLSFFTALPPFRFGQKKFILFDGTMKINQAGKPVA